jgi:transposase
MRRIFTVDQKRQIVEESKSPGLSVVKVARRHRLSTALLFRWRRQERLGQLASDALATEGERQGLETGAA